MSTIGGMGGWGRGRGGGGGRERESAPVATVSAQYAVTTLTHTAHVYCTHRHSARTWVPGVCFRQFSSSAKPVSSAGRIAMPVAGMPLNTNRHALIGSPRPSSWPGSATTTMRCCCCCCCCCCRRRRCCCFGVGGFSSCYFCWVVVVVGVCLGVRAETGRALARHPRQCTTQMRLTRRLRCATIYVQCDGAASTALVAVRQSMGYISSVDIFSYFWRTSAAGLCAVAGAEPDDGLATGACSQPRTAGRASNQHPQPLGLSTRRRCSSIRCLDMVGKPAERT